jgi:hypothetical protein
MINMNLYSIIKIYGFKLNSDKKNLFVNIKIDLTLFISFSQNGFYLHLKGNKNNKQNGVCLHQ